MTDRTRKTNRDALAIALLHLEQGDELTFGSTEIHYNGGTYFLSRGANRDCTSSNWEAADIAINFERYQHPIGFRVGDKVSWSRGTDVLVGHVVKATAKQVHVVEAECRLLNGAGSDEPDALHFEPGGFCGHTSGKQRWEIKRGDGAPIKFGKRKSGRYVLCGANYVGAPYLWHGHDKHYDFNF